MRADVLVSRVGIAAGVAALTHWFGWPAPALVGAAMGAVPAATSSAGALTRRPAREAAFAAVLGWGGLLAWALLGGRATRVAPLVGGLAGARGGSGAALVAGLAVLTLAIGALLAWSSATLVAGLVAPRTARRIAARPGGVTLSPTPTATPVTGAILTGAPHAGAPATGAPLTGAPERAPAAPTP